MSYVYYSYEEWGRGYIGASSRNPLDDEEYLGSFRDASFHPTHKIILAEFDTWEETLEAEVTLHAFFDVARNPHFANRAKQTSKGFTTRGMEISEETRRKQSEMRRGVKKSEEWKKRMSELHLERQAQRTQEERSESARKGWESRIPVRKMWINNGVRETLIPVGQPIPEGWKKGRG